MGLLLGAGGGAALTLWWNPVTTRAADGAATGKPDADDSGAPAALASHVPAGLDPGAVAHLHADRVLAAATTPAAGPAATPDPHQPIVTRAEDIDLLPPTASTGSSAQVFDATAVSPLAEAVYQQIDADPAWDLFVIRQIDLLADAGENTGAVSLASGLTEPVRRASAGAALAARLAREGVLKMAEDLFAQLVLQAGTAPGGDLQRVLALAAIARHQHEVEGKALDAEVTATKARLIARSAADACDMAAGEAEVAGLLYRFGKPDEAQSAYARSNAALRRVQYRHELLPCLRHLAPVYGRSGNLGSAVTLLEDMVRGATSETDANMQNYLFHQASRAFSELGESLRAQQLAERISAPLLRAKAQYLNTMEEVLRGQTGAVMTAAEAISDPATQARALGILALAQSYRDAHRPLSRPTLDRARSLITELSDPVERIMITSELARLSAHIGDEDAADTTFAFAARLLETLPAGYDRQRPAAVLAANLARALRPGDARRYLRQVTDPRLARPVRRALAQSEQALATLRGETAVTHFAH